MAKHRGSEPAEASSGTCPLSGAPLTEFGFCLSCDGYHTPPDIHACRRCVARVNLDGWCGSCEHLGGGVGYELVRRVYVPSGRREDPGSLVSVWAGREMHFLSREENRARCRRLIEAMDQGRASVEAMAKEWET